MRGYCLCLCSYAGKKLPDLDSLEWFQGEEEAKAALCSPNNKVVIFWAKFAKGDWKATIHHFEELRCDSAQNQANLPFLILCCHCDCLHCRSKKFPTVEFPTVAEQLALLSTSSLAIPMWPFLAAQCRGVEWE